MINFVIGFVSGAAAVVFFLLYHAKKNNLFDLAKIIKKV